MGLVFRCYIAVHKVLIEFLFPYLQLQLPAMSVASVATSMGVTKPLISVMGTVVPQPPPLTGNVDPTKIEEIRRTVYVGNLSTKVCVSCRMVRMIAVCTFFCISILTCKATGNRCFSLVLCVFVCLSPYLLSSLCCGCLFSFIYLFPLPLSLLPLSLLPLSLSPFSLSPFVSYSYLSSFFAHSLSLSPCGCGCCFFSRVSLADG